MSTNDGDSIVRNVLSMARIESNQRRINGLPHFPFSSGYQLGQVAIAEIYLGADPLAVTAARNELYFLRRYTEARA